MAERRSYRRYAVWFPVTFGLPSGDVWGICRDASQSGLLASTVTAIDVGARVHVRFKITARGTERTLEAVVVRQLSNRDDLLLAFPHRVAVEFTTPVPDLLGELARHADTEIL